MNIDLGGNTLVDGYFAGLLLDSTGSTGTSGQILSSTGTGSLWESLTIGSLLTIGINLASAGAAITGDVLDVSGFNTANELLQLDGSGNLTLPAGIWDNSPNLGTSGQVLTSTGSGVLWRNGGAGFPLTVTAPSTIIVNDSDGNTLIATDGNGSYDGNPYLQETISGNPNTIGFDNTGIPLVNTGMRFIGPQIDSYGVMAVFQSNNGTNNQTAISVITPDGVGTAILQAVSEAFVDGGYSTQLFSSTNIIQMIGNTGANLSQLQAGQLFINDTYDDGTSATLQIAGNASINGAVVLDGSRNLTVNSINSDSGAITSNGLGNLQLGPPAGGYYTPLLSVYDDSGNPANCAMQFAANTNMYGTANCLGFKDADNSENWVVPVFDDNFSGTYGGNAAWNGALGITIAGSPTTFVFGVDGGFYIQNSSSVSSFLIESSGDLTTVGAISTDGGAVTTDGSGGLSVDSITIDANLYAGISSTIIADSNGQLYDPLGNVILNSSGDLSIYGSTSLDGGAITTDGIGTLYAPFISVGSNISLQWDGTLVAAGGVFEVYNTGDAKALTLELTSSSGIVLNVNGASSLDDGTITTDGSGNLTMSLGLFYPTQAATSGAPAYALGAMYFDTTLNKLRIGGASGWETVTSS